MKGVIFPNAGAEPEVVDDLEKPSPGPDQVLVRSIWTAINPVYVKTHKLAYIVIFSLDWPSLHPFVL